MRKRGGGGGLGRADHQKDDSCKILPGTEGTDLKDGNNNSREGNDYQDDEIVKEIVCQPVGWGVDTADELKMFGSVLFLLHHKQDKVGQKNAEPKDSQYTDGKSIRILGPTLNLLIISKSYELIFNN